MSGKHEDKRPEHTSGKHADSRTAKDTGQVGKHRPKDGNESNSKP